MPDQLNKQSLVNLLIDSPLREPIKINLIDIVNNTSDVDLPKVFPTITKELEIFQKATERRMKLADETIAKLGGTAVTPSSEAQTPPLASGAGPLDLPPLPTPPPVPMPAAPATPLTSDVSPLSSTPSLSVPPLDLPPLPTSPVPTPPISPLTSDISPLTTPNPAASPDADEAALAEIQKELDSLKSSAMTDAAQPVAAPAPVQQ
jgi:hypothetical protein